MGDFNKNTIFDPERFNHEWLNARKDILSKNEVEFGIKNSLEKQIKKMSNLNLEQKDLGMDRKGREILGAYFPLRRTIAIDDSLPLGSQKAFNTYVHEKTHASAGLFQGIIPQNKKVKQIVGDKWDKEIYPMLQEVRFNFKINPNFKFENSDVEDLRNDAKNTEYDNFLNTFSNEELQQLLNDVAQNASVKQRPFAEYAQQGTKLLTPHKDYLGIPYKQDGDYNYFSAHPENIPTKPEEHWTSRNPVTGQLLKSKKHPTFNLLLNGEQEAGMQIYRGLNGELYSYPKEQQVPLYLKKYNYDR